MEDEDVEILGYSEHGGKPKSLIPKFGTILHEKTPKNLEIIREKREFIRRVVRKIELSRELEYQADFVEKAFSWLGLNQIEKEHKRFKFKYGIELNSPSAEDLEKIILNWKSQNSESASAWENLGFQLDGEQKVRWIDSFLASEVFSLKIQRLNEEIVDVDSLLDELSKNREHILDALGIADTTKSVALNSNGTEKVPQPQASFISSD